MVDKEYMRPSNFNFCIRRSDYFNFVETHWLKYLIPSGFSLHLLRFLPTQQFTVPVHCFKKIVTICQLSVYSVIVVNIFFLLPHIQMSPSSTCSVSEPRPVWNVICKAPCCLASREVLLMEYRPRRSESKGREAQKALFPWLPLFQVG